MQNSLSFQVFACFIYSLKMKRLIVPTIYSHQHDNLQQHKAQARYCDNLTLTGILSVRPNIQQQHSTPIGHNVMPEYDLSIANNRQLLKRVIRARIVEDVHVIAQR